MSALHHHSSNTSSGHIGAEQLIWAPPLTPLRAAVGVLIWADQERA
jgi:hypothetical protein